MEVAVTANGIPIQLRNLTAGSPLPAARRSHRMGCGFRWYSQLLPLHPGTAIEVSSAGRSGGPAVAEARSAPERNRQPRRRSMQEMRIRLWGKDAAA